MQRRTRDGKAHMSAAGRPDLKPVAAMAALPFIRWAGAKRRQQSTLLGLAPSTFGRYFEPFLGSGALFFALRPQDAVLNDRIAPLIATWSAVRDTPMAVAEQIAEWPVDRSTYYAVRGLTPSDAISAAAKFIYLNKTCYNGLYRVNSSGNFNVPYGRPKSGNVANASSLSACAAALRGSVQLMAGDFEAALEGAGPGDFVYLDPPYVTGHSNNGFVEYNEVLFNWSDQVRLAKVAQALKESGVHVVISNAWHEAVRQLYPGFQVLPITTHSSMAGASSKRLRVTEAAFYTEPSA